MMDEELEQLLEGTENVDMDAFMDDVLNNQEDPDTRIVPESDKESPEVTKSVDMLTIHDDEVKEESVGDEFELRRRENGKGIEETRDTHPPTPIRSPRTHIASILLDKETLQELTVTTEDAHSFTDKEKLQELTVTDSTHSSSSPKPNTGRFKRYKSFIQQMGGCYGYMFGHLKKHFMPRKKFHQLAKHLHSTMAEFLPSMVGERVKEIAQKIVLLYVAEGLLLDKQKTQADVAAMIAKAVDSFLRDYMSNNILHVHLTQAHASTAQDLQYLMIKDNEKLRNLSIWWSLKIKFDKLAPVVAPCRTAAIRLRDHDDHQDDAHLKGENSAKRQKMSTHGTYTVGESSLEQPMEQEQEPNPSSSGTQEQLDEFDAWMKDVGIDDDEVFVEEVSQELLEDMRRGQHHVDQMQNYLKSEIVWESRKERLSLPTPNKPSSVYHSCQRDPKAPPMTLLNQDLFYLKCGNSRSKKYTLSLHKYPAVSFHDDDIKE
ncbi:hypothetical protein Tco_0955408 [Tanacetum coccineum]|uniref:Histone H2A/H2B/H3 domain-containing protein n=1 Tax=Tanacetum coccineum TaxID=301880 RepID=A0ABQ5E746_9ASTR